MKAKRFFLGLGRGLLYMLLYLGVQFAVSVYAMVAYAVRAVLLSPTGMPDIQGLMQGMAEFTLKHATLLTLVSCVAALLLLVLIHKTGGRQPLQEACLVKMRPGFIWPAALGGCAMAFVISIGVGLLPIPETMLQSYGEASSVLEEGSPAVTFIAAVLVAPVTEEVIFRGMAHGSFKRGMPTAVALLLQSALFGLMHGDWLWIAYTFLLGVLMTLVFEAAGSLWASIIFHAAFNLCGSYVVPYLQYPNAVAVYAALLLALVVAAACGVRLAMLHRAEKAQKA